MVKPGPPVKGRVPVPSAAESVEKAGIAQILALAPPRSRGSAPLPPDPATAPDIPQRARFACTV